MWTVMDAEKESYVRGEGETNLLLENSNLFDQAI